MKNSRQKRAVKVRAALLALAKDLNPSTQAQIGVVRSSRKDHIVRDNAIYTGFSVGMRENSVNTDPKLGKVVNGTFKARNPLVKRRWSTKF